MLDISALLEEIKASPYEEMTVVAPHTGTIFFPETLKEGVAAHGPLGTWKEKPGTLFATIERERNPQPLFCQEKGEVMSINRDVHGTFVEAGTELVRLRHFLSKDEVLKIILKRALHLYVAPERAKYYFIPGVDIKIKVSGPKAVSVHDGEEIFIMSRMKREAPLRYSGPEGVIYAVYFTHNQNVDAGQPLIGVCPPDLIDQIEDVVTKVHMEWKEQG